MLLKRFYRFGFCIHNIARAIFTMVQFQLVKKMKERKKKKKKNLLRCCVRESRSPRKKKEHNIYKKYFTYIQQYNK